MALKKKATKPDAPVVLKPDETQPTFDLAFKDESGAIVAKLSWQSGKVKFEGNMNRAAEGLFNVLKDKINRHIERQKRATK